MRRRRGGAGSAAYYTGEDDGNYDDFDADSDGEASSSSSSSSDVYPLAAAAPPPPARPAMTLCMSVLMATLAFAVAWALTQALTTYGEVYPKAGFVEEGVAREQGFAPLLAHPDLRFVPYNYTGESLRVGPLLKNVCVSKDAGILSVRRRRDIATSPLTLFGKKALPLVTEVPLDEAPQSGVFAADPKARPLCMVLFLFSDGGRANPFFEVVAPLSRSWWGATTVCQELSQHADPVVAMLTPHAHAFLDSMEPALLKEMFDVDLHVALPTQFHSQDTPWLCSDAVYVMQHDSLQTENANTYILPSHADRLALWDRVLPSPSLPVVAAAAAAAAVSPARGLVVATSGLSWADSGLRRDAFSAKAQALGFYPVTYVRGLLPFKEREAYRLVRDAAAVVAALPALSLLTFWAQNTTSVLCVVPEEPRHTDVVLTKHTVSFYGFEDYTELRATGTTRQPPFALSHFNATDLLSRLGRVASKRRFGRPLGL